MSIQRKLNEFAIIMFPMARTYILNAPDFESNQMYSKALQLINNMSIPATEMSIDELTRLDEEIVEVFKHKGWI